MEIAGCSLSCRLPDVGPHLPLRGAFCRSRAGYLPVRALQGLLTGRRTTWWGASPVGSVHVYERPSGNDASCLLTLFDQAPRSFIELSSRSHRESLTLLPTIVCVCCLASNNLYCLYSQQKMKLSCLLPVAALLAVVASEPIPGKSIGTLSIYSAVY